MHYSFTPMVSRHNHAPQTHQARGIGNVFRSPPSHTWNGPNISVVHRPKFSGLSISFKGTKTAVGSQAPYTGGIFFAFSDDNGLPPKSTLAPLKVKGFVDTSRTRDDGGEEVKVLLSRHFCSCIQLNHCSVWQRQNFVLHLGCKTGWYLKDTGPSVRAVGNVVSRRYHPDRRQ